MLARSIKVDMQTHTAQAGRRKSTLGLGALLWTHLQLELCYQLDCCAPGQALKLDDGHVYVEGGAKAGKVGHEEVTEGHGAQVSCSQARWLMSQGAKQGCGMHCATQGHMR